MPIRFDSGDSNKGKGGGNIFGSGGGDTGKKAVGILAILALIFLIFKRPKILLFLLLIGGGVAGYFYWKDPEGFKAFFQGLGNDNNDNNQTARFGEGCNFDPQKYDATEVFEPLAAESSKNNIPSKTSLRKFAPNRLNQGQQGSCVGWATAYAARTILHAEATGSNPNSVAFSPSFMYNQIAINASCQGSYTSEALKKMKNDGLVFLSKFPYDENDCSRQPNNNLLQEAKNFRIRGYNRLTKSGDDYDVDIDAVRQNIAQGGPVVIAFKVPPSFHYLQDKLWQPNPGEERRVDEYGGHAMCLIGYDDNYQGGAFEVMNSWSDEWGDDGCFWITYDDFYTFCREAYGIYPDAQSPKIKTNSTKIEASFGLVDLATGYNKELEKRDGRILYGSTIQPNDKFVVEVTNSVECYVYIFGQETDGSSYVLFPYTEKHSPYCGITGTRHFPNKNNGESLRADDLGDEDFMAIVVTKNAIDYNRVNNAISNASGNRYDQQVTAGLRAAGIKVNTTTQFSTNGETVKFKGDTAGGDAVALVFSFYKN